tara:strand:+ start:12272 stop:14170 length:1899 start_codon:yes stop_codon:yes gene_type:complete
MIEVEHSGTGQVVEFPDGTAPEVIQKAMTQLDEPTYLDNVAGRVEASAAVGSGIAGTIAGGLAGLASVPFADDPAQVSSDVQEALTYQPRTEAGARKLTMLGDLVEMGVDIANFPISGLAGLSGLLAGEGVDKSVDMIESVQEVGLGRTAGNEVFERTGSPALATLSETLPTAIAELAGLKGAGMAAKGTESLAGATQRSAQAVGQVVESVARKAGNAAESVFQYQTPTRQRIAKLLESGSTDIETAKFQPGPKTETGAPTAVPNPLAKRAITQGFDEGVIAPINQSSRASKDKMIQMVDIMERGKKNRKYALQNRPSDVAGNTLAERVRVIFQSNRRAGKELDVVANSLRGQPVDIQPAILGFSENLDSMGIELIDDGSGGLKPSFTDSIVAPGDRGPIKEVIRQMVRLGKKGVPDANDAHVLKRIIDSNVTFGKTKTGLSGDTSRVLKQFRAELDQALDNTFPAYDQVNTQYAKTRGALDSIQDVAGRKMDLTGERAGEAVGTLLRRVMGNAQSRVRLLDSIDEIETVAREYGGGGTLKIEGSGLGGDDLLMEILFADELDRVFGTVARTSFQGQVEQGIKQASKAATRDGIAEAAIGAAAKGAEKLRGIDDAGRFKAIRELLKEQQGTN